MTHTLQFWFEGLEVYHLARAALAAAIPVRSKLRGLPGELASQLERALLSVVANIAEGAGRASKADRARHYAIARGSANEAGAVVEIAALYGVLDEREHAALRGPLVRTAHMLSALMR
jgi:four helix bundle protein